MTLTDRMCRLLRRRGGTMPAPRPLADDEVRVILSPGWVQLPPGSEGRFPGDFLERLNHPTKKPSA
ncbi:MAG: hypothetical protein HOZ81_04510 [Streptomyces sp.]|nr:hypothetical protein [Streptomyces sp.]